MHFTLSDIKLSVYLGVVSKERSKRQQILVTVHYETDTRKSEQSDDITDTMDYFVLYRFLRDFPGARHFCLLEHFHAELTAAIRQRFVSPGNLQISITKFPFRKGESVTIRN